MFPAIYPYSLRTLNLHTAHIHGHTPALRQQTPLRSHAGEIEYLNALNILKSVAFKAMKDAAVTEGSLYGADRREMEADAADTRELHFDQRVERLKNTEIRTHQQLQRLLAGIEASLEIMLRSINERAGLLFKSEYKSYDEKARNGAYPMAPMMLLNMIKIPVTKEIYAAIVDHVTELKVATDEVWDAIFLNADRRLAFNTYTSGAMSVIFGQQAATRDNTAAKTPFHPTNRGSKARRLNDSRPHNRDPPPPQEWRSAGRGRNDYASFQRDSYQTAGRGGGGKGSGGQGDGSGGKGGKGRGGKGIRTAWSPARAPRTSTRAPPAVIAFAEQVRERMPAGTPKAERYCGLLNTRGYCGEPNCGYLHRKAPWVKNRFSSPPPDGQ